MFDGKSNVGSVYVYEYNNDKYGIGDDDEPSLTLTKKDF